MTLQPQSANRSRSSRLRIFPLAFRGSSSTNIDPLRRLEVGELLPCVVDELGLGDLAARDDDRRDGLDPAVVGQADHGDLGDRLVGVEHVLDLA